MFQFICELLLFCVIFGTLLNLEAYGFILFYLICGIYAYLKSDDYQPGILDPDDLDDLGKHISLHMLFNLQSVCHPIF